MVVVAQLVRALDCGSRGRRFETGLPPKRTPREIEGFSSLNTPIYAKTLFSVDISKLKIV